MGSLRNLRKKGLAADMREVAGRLRDAREDERFSQYDLAPQLGITRAVLSNIELCQSPLSFRVGMEFCRRLNFLPRWLATGTEPQRPFVPVEELGVEPAVLRRHTRHGVDFLSGYHSVLQRPIEEWLKRHSTDELVMRALTNDPAAAIRKMHTTDLIRRLDAAMHGLKNGSEAERSLHVKLAGLFSSEMAARLDALERKFRK